MSQNSFRIWRYFPVSLLLLSLTVGLASDKMHISNPNGCLKLKYSHWSLDRRPQIFPPLSSGSHRINVRSQRTKVVATRWEMLAFLNWFPTTRHPERCVFHGHVQTTKLEMGVYFLQDMVRDLSHQTLSKTLLDKHSEVWKVGRREAISIISHPLALEYFPFSTLSSHFSEEERNGNLFHLLFYMCARFDHSWHWARRRLMIGVVPWNKP